MLGMIPFLRDWHHARNGTTSATFMLSLSRNKLKNCLCWCRAPEKLDTDKTKMKYTLKADIWAFGILLGQLCSVDPFYPYACGMVWQDIREQVCKLEHCLEETFASRVHSSWMSMFFVRSPYSSLFAWTSMDLPAQVTNIGM